MFFGISMEGMPIQNCDITEKPLHTGGVNITERSEECTYRENAVRERT